MEVVPMLMRTDPFRDLNRLTEQLLGGTARPTLLAMDAWRDQDSFVVEFDLPGVEPGAVELDVEGNVLRVNVDRPGRPVVEGQVLATERPRGRFSRQLILGDDLDTEHANASYQAGVLRLEFPVAEQAKPRKVSVEVIETPATSTTTDHDPAPAPEERKEVNA
jgi:HSP20 family protein